MNNIIVYVDDTAYAHYALENLRLSEGARRPVRWIVVGCAPRVTHRASKWVTNSARESWRGKWADKVFAALVPLLAQNGDVVVTRIAQSTLRAQTEKLIDEYGVARVVDARKPKARQDIAAEAPESVAPMPRPASGVGIAHCAAALFGIGLWATAD